MVDKTYPYMTVLQVADLDKHSGNPNEQDERTFNALCESILEDGWIEPMATVVPTADGRYDIVSGHHRYDAALVLGISEGPCLVLDPEKFDKDRQEMAMVRVNILRGKINPAKFTAMYERLAKDYDTEALKALMGFTTEDSFNALYVQVKRALPPELAKAMDEQKDEIKTIDDLSLVLNRLFREHGETLPSNMMVFSWAGKDVLWVRADDDLWKMVTEVAKQVARDKGDMAERMKQIMTAGLESETLDPVV